MICQKKSTTIVIQPKRRPNNGHHTEQKYIPPVYLNNDLTDVRNERSLHLHHINSTHLGNDNRIY